MPQSSTPKPATPQDRLKKLQVDLDFWSSKAENLDGILSDKESHIDNLIRRIGHLERVIVDQSTVIGDYLSNVEKALVEKEEYAHSMRKLVADLQAAIARKDQHIEDAADHAAKLYQAIDEKEAYAGNVTARMHELEAAVAASGKRLQTAAQVRDASEREAAELRAEVERLARELTLIRRSGFWRLTAPLKKIRDCWRRLFT